MATDAVALFARPDKVPLGVAAGGKRGERVGEDDDVLIQFYWTPTWLFVDSPGQTVQDFRLFVGCAQIIQRTKLSDSLGFEQDFLAKNSQNSLLR